MRVVAIVVAAALFAPVAQAAATETTAQVLLDDWKAGDPGMTGLAEVIASAFASGLSWAGGLAGTRVYCPPPGLQGREIMSAFERFVGNNPGLADKPYGEALAATLGQAFPCAAK